MGDALLGFAAANPDWNCVGVDVYQPGIGSIVNAINSEKINNIRLAEMDGLGFLTTVPSVLVNQLWLFFPDPWPKKRHHKRRIVTTEFVSELQRVLAVSGSFFVATDWTPYATEIEKLLRDAPKLDGGRVSRPDFRPITRFEARGERLGHEVFDFRFCRTH